ncbi:hypothetical protein GBAR_LOCUS20597 [Geodia barretti]|uniref:Uncharacterized protein n=1 Tax=Geodia barretti TaxID=519541 RepID=A0AA35SXV2_GEOBA|nr:hypothetical protein GBAR_LOCUS20597 [Geodia barretti]
MPNRLINETSPYLVQHANNPWTGIPGERRPCRRPARRTNPSSSASATRRATGATLWSGSPSRTTKSPS